MIRRHILDSIRRAMTDTPVVLLNGARQTGKTTLAQAIGDQTGAQYFALDDSATLALATALNDRNQVSRIDEFDLCRNQPPLPLTAPWRSEPPP